MGTYSITTIIMFALGGVSLFLYGIKLMSTSLQSLNSNKVERFIKVSTKNLFTAFLAGILSTALIQSSSAITAIVLSLISVNLIDFRRGLTVIIGSNIGTTFTAFIISLNIGDYSLYIVALGIFLYLFNKKNSIKYIGGCILGLGFLFFGLNIMNEGLIHILEYPFISNVMMNISSSNTLSFLFGTLLTAIIQSSSATIGILQKLHVIGIFNTQSATTFILGANIGTTITGVIAAIGCGVVAKKVANINLLFNVLGGILFLIFLTPYSNIIISIVKSFSLSAEKEIFINHFLYNLISSLLFMFILIINEYYPKKKSTIITN